MNFKKDLYITMIAIFGVIVITILGNIIIIGEKISAVFHTTIAEYIFYLILVCLLYLKVIKPLLRIYRMPEFPPLDSDIDKFDDEDIKKISKLLTTNCYHLNENEKEELLEKLDWDNEAELTVKNKNKIRFKIKVRKIKK